MDGQLSDEERRLIDEAVEQGRVKHIKQGQSAWPGYRYDNAQGKLVSVDMKQHSKMTGWKTGASERAAKKRAKAGRLLMDGMEHRAVAEKIGVSISTLRNYIKVLQREGQPVPSFPQVEVEWHGRCDKYLRFSKTHVGNIETMAAELGIGHVSIPLAFKKADRWDEYTILKQNLLANRQETRRSA